MIGKTLHKPFDFYTFHFDCNSGAESNKVLFPSVKCFVLIHPLIKSCFNVLECKLLLLWLLFVVTVGRGGCAQSLDLGHLTGDLLQFFNGYATFNYLSAYLLKIGMSTDTHHMTFLREA